MGLSYGGRTSVSIVENIFSKGFVPIQTGFSKVSNALNERVLAITSVFKYQAINEQLRQENERLEKQIVELNLDQKKLDELKALEASLNYIEVNDYDYVSADIIGKDPGNWYKMFTINAGTDHGVFKDSVVIVGTSLVGRVYEAGENYAKVLSIIDNKSNISFELLTHEKNYQGIIEHTEQGQLEGSLFEPNADVKVGEKIITSGLGIYPRGLIIGTIVENYKDENKLLQTITVEPTLDFKALKKVMVLKNNPGYKEWLNDY
jgi:rod shape-determining protein MreC